MSLWDRALDASVVMSFDRRGFERHARRFVSSEREQSLEGRRLVITGANSGIGRAAARDLAALGARCFLLCRSPQRGEEARDKIREETGNPEVHFIPADLSDLSSLAPAAEALGPEPVDGLVHNAGVLPLERQLSPQGAELTWATHLLGPLVLDQLLRPRLRQSGRGRILYVSSGGMYTQRLSLQDPQWADRSYDGVRAYAQTKRAQVILAEVLGERLATQGIRVDSMHPGWVDTPGVERSLPRFYRWTGSILRSPAQGADTIVWYLSCPELPGPPGRFFFDRQAQDPYPLPGTREGAETREALWDLLSQGTGIPKEQLLGEGSTP